MDIITEAFIAPLEYSFMVRALIVSVIVGIMCPTVGAYVVTRGLGFMGDALAHAVLPAMALAFMLGLSPFIGIIPGAIAVALLVGYMTMRAGVSADTSIGILFAGMFALGLVMMTMAGGLPVDVEDIILGQVLGTSRSDVIITMGLAGGVLILIWALHKELVFTSFDPTGASVIGIPDTSAGLHTSGAARAGHINRAPGGGRSAGHLHADNACGHRPASGKELYPVHTNRFGGRRGVRDNRTLPVVPLQPSVRARYGAGRYGLLRPGGGVHQDTRGGVEEEDGVDSALRGVADHRVTWGAEVERERGFEPPTPSLARKRSTTELLSLGANVWCRGSESN